MKCKDCAPGVKRPVRFPGPRCFTHHKAFERAAKTRAANNRVARTYGINPDAYTAILEAQGGTCAICQRATGATKRLAVDHDHTCCTGPTSCGKCVRGLLCSPCNRLLGHLRDDPTALRRAAAYLRDHPAQAVLNGLDEREIS